MIIIIVIIFIAVFLGKNIAQTSYDIPFFIVIGLMVSIVTFLRPDLGLLIIIFSMLLSPEIKVGSIPGRDIVLRLEDFLLIIITFTWLARTAINKELGLFRSTPLNVPIGIYIATCIVLTLRGIILGYVIPLKGFFYLFKYIEYFVLYFMVANQVRTRSQIKMFIVAFILTCFITCIYANLHIGLVSRATAPFEGAGEPNTLGGYLVFMLAILMGIFLYSTSKKTKFFLAMIGIFFILPAFLFTLSRTSYIAVVPMWFSLIIFGQRKVMLISILLLAVFLGLVFMPYPVKERIKYTFTARSEQIRPASMLGMELDPSASARIRSWEDIWKKSEHKILGYGVTGFGFIDGQYMRILAEMGIIGLCIFLFLLWAIFKNGLDVFLMVRDKLFKGISLGFLSGFVGLVFFNVGANGFILTRIMEPFFFMAAIVMLLPMIPQSEEYTRCN
ncbi:MAG: O-antigen ligase family protein [Candidatus Omnitrophica bacterium]|nr:O-antigen ligase family protein [Candidatus Omnitrophota bacterium]